MPESHYFDRRPSVASAPRQVTLVLPDVTLDLRTDAGVFAADAVDPGTKLLLLEVPAPTVGDVVADVGCGYGPLAITLARRQPEATVWAIDVNDRALDLCAANAAAHGLENVRVARPEEVPDSVVFDRIVSNPPIRVGKAALHELLAGWLARLRPAGVAHLVVQRHLGADSLATWLGGEGWGVTRLRSRRGYRVLEVRGPRTTPDDTQ